MILWFRESGLLGLKGLLGFSDECSLGVVRGFRRQGLMAFSGCEGSAMEVVYRW